MIDYDKIFDGTAAYYAQYRRVYPAEVFEDITAHYGLDTNSRSKTLVDLGCGTGQITIPMAPFFEHAYGVDASADMLRVAQESAESSAVKNISWVHSKAEEVDFATLAHELGSAIEAEVSLAANDTHAVLSMDSQQIDRAR